ncbi:MAG: short-chain dehydrogenase/reductase [Myxococcaceae bacterium]|nr:short-chain dehydrogenase/reductase [Myxococcaceae bacterium]
MKATRALIIGNTDGIGLALTKRLLDMGYQLSGISRRASELQHPAYEHVVCDVTSSDYATMLTRLLQRVGGFDLCVYCVGIGELLDLANMSAESSIFRANLLGLVDTASLVLPAMVARGSGHFVGLSSIADEAISADTPSYAASKAGVSSYLAGLALALRPRGVRVSNVRFGFVDTKMAKSPVRPFMISVDKAVDVLMRCLKRQPARLTYPWRTALLVRVLRWVALVRLALG